jgi:hypothetical protein
LNLGPGSPRQTQVQADNPFLLSPHAHAQVHSGPMLSGGPETRSRARPVSDREILEAEELDGSASEDELEARGPARGRRVVSDSSMASGLTEAEELEGEEEDKHHERPDDGSFDRSFVLIFLANLT